MNAVDQFVGSGIIFPIEIDGTGKVVVSNGFKLIRASLYTILSWPQRDRFFNNNFGARLWELLEEPNDLVAAALVETFIIEAIEKWETRVELLQAKIVVDTTNLEKVDISLTYRIRNSKVEDTFIYPFYKELIH